MAKPLVSKWGDQLTPLNFEKNSILGLENLKNFKVASYLIPVNFSIIPPMTRTHPMAIHCGRVMSIIRVIRMMCINVAEKKEIVGFFSTTDKIS